MTTQTHTPQPLNPLFMCLSTAVKMESNNEQRENAISRLFEFTQAADCSAARAIALKDVFCLR